MHTKRFNENTNNLKVWAAVILAESMLDGDSQMLHDLRSKNDFKYNSGSGLEIYLKLYTKLPPVTVNFYRPVNPWSKVIGYSNGKEIFINARKINYLTIRDIVANLCHEYAHYAGFNHGTGRTANYKTEEKCLYSVPYFISENIANDAWSFKKQDISNG